MLGRLMLAAALAAAVLMLPTFVQADQGAATPKLPKGIPGFYNPQTGVFTPLTATAPAADGQEINGNLSVDLSFPFSSDYPTIFCSVTISFGNVTSNSSPLFVNHSVSSSFNFSGDRPSYTVPVPYSYTPNGNGTPEMRVSVDCYATDNNNVRHEASNSPAAMAIPSGASSVSVDMNL